MTEFNPITWRLTSRRRSTRQAQGELEVYLATWKVMHPGIEAYVVEIYELHSRS